MKLDKAISVNSVREEYIYVSEQRCKCGGMLKVVRQNLENFPFVHDILTTKCEKCSKTKKILFDIRSFFYKQAKDILLKEMKKCPYCGTMNELDAFRCKNEDCLEILPLIDKEKNEY